MKVLIYNCNFYKIGGIETFVKNFVKRMSKYYETTCVYENGDYHQLLEISKSAEVIKYNSQSFETDICLWVSGWGKRPISNIKAKKHFQMIHADYKNIKERLGFEFIPQKEIDGYICVGKAVAEVFKELHGNHPYVKGKPIVVIHNLLDKDLEIEKVLNLIVVSRIGSEKGFERVIKFVNELKERNRKFLLHIWGDIPDAKYKTKINSELQNIPEAIFMGTRLDIHSFIANADYLLQFSDTEAFCYSIYESLQANTPCIVTAFPSAYEQIKEAESGYILPFDLFTKGTKEEWDSVIDKIYNKIPNEIKFKELSDESNWIELFGEPQTKPKKKKSLNFEPDTLIVKTIESFIDSRTKQRHKKGDTFTITNERYNEIKTAEEIQKTKLIEIT